MVTARDDVVVGAANSLLTQMTRFRDAPRDTSYLHSEFHISRKLGWDILRAHDSLQAEPDLGKFLSPITYRPFDKRTIFYHDDLVWRTVHKVMDHVRDKANFSLTFNRVIEEKRPYTDIFVFEGMIQHHSLSLKEVNYIAPLYLYPSEQDLDQTRRVNFDPKLFAALKARATDAAHPEPDEVQVFDYIYGTLHCPAYRATYAEFLKIDFPRIPWPASPAEFWDVSAKGQSLRKLHLMDANAIGATPYPYLGDGTNTVEKPEYKDGKVYISAAQYFDAAPEISWGFYIGGYQPAQKWLKDRRGRALSIDDIRHYQRILKILSETDRIMKTITMTLDAPG